MCVCVCLFGVVGLACLSSQKGASNPTDMAEMALPLSRPLEQCALIRWLQKSEPGPLPRVVL